MSGDIVLSAAMRNNLLSLQGTQRSIDTTQFRLSTGLKVNSALDNPQNFFAAQSLSNRASDLQRLLDGISQSIRTIEEADKGVSALTDLVEQADAIATEAQSELRASEGFANIRGNEDLSGVTDLTSLAGIDAGDEFRVVFSEYNSSTNAIDTEEVTVAIAANNTVDNIVAQINSDVNVNDKIRASVTSGGQLKIESLIDGGNVRVHDDDDIVGTPLGRDGFTALGLDSLVSIENDNATTRAGGTAIAGNTLASLAAADAAKADGKYQASATLETAGFLTTGAAGVNEVDFTITVDGTAGLVRDLDKGSTIQEVVDFINNDPAINDGVTASFNTDTGRIEIQAEDGVGQVEMAFTEISGTGIGPAFGFGTGATDTLAVGGTQSEAFTFVGTSADLAQFESDYNNVRDQIDGLVEDAQYRGTNLLSGDNLVTDFNEDRSNNLTTDGVDFTALGLGLSVGDFTSSATVQQSIDEIRASLNDVRNFGQSIANDLSIIQTRKDFTEQTINTLKAGADDLTVADLNTEGANLLALQTRQQLGVTSLSLASQSQQSVLRLF